MPRLAETGNTPRPRTARDLRPANRAQVFRALHRLGGVGTRPEIGALTGLSQATVSLLVGELLARGVLVPGATEASAGGRPRQRVAVDPDAGLLIGVDVAETYVHARSFDLALRPVDQWRLDHEPAHGADRLVATCGEAVKSLQRNAPGRRVLGVGVSVPGQVDPDSGVAVGSPDGTLHDAPIGPALARRLGLAVHLENPLRASVVAELWAGAGREVDDLAVVTLGTGVGAGLAVDGVLRRGSGQLAGEWGHIPVGGERICRCGATGCLEAYLGAPGLLATMAELGAGPDLLRGGDQTLAVAALADAADTGQPVAQATLHALAARLGDGLVLLRHVVDPALVVVGGWVADALGDRLLDPARRRAEQRLLRAPDRPDWVRASTLGDAQVALGAAALTLDVALSAALAR